MKLTIARSALLAALTPCVSVTSTKAVSKHGSMLLLHATDQLTLRASRDFTSVRAHAEAEVATPGSICVPAEEFAKRIQLMPDGPIALSVASNKLTIKSGKSKHDLRTLSASDFPAFPRVDADAVRVDGKSLASLIDATANAVEEGNPRGVEFDGLVLTTRDGKLVATTSDGRGRFARSETPHSAGAIDTFVTTDALGVVRASTAEHVDIAVGDRAVFFTMDCATLAYQRLEIGELPYDRGFAMFAANDGPSVRRKDLAAKVKAVTPDGMSGSVLLSLACAEGVLTLTHTTLDGDESTDEMECAGEAWSATIEAKYLRDALRFGGDDIMLVAPAANCPLVIKSGCATYMIGQSVPVTRAEETKGKVAA